MTTYKRSGAIILNKNLTKCLMVFQKSSLFWGIPKGSKLDIYEDNFICMLREVKEEVGLDLNHIKIDVLGSFTIHLEACIYVIKLNLDPLPICSPPMEDGNENHEIEKVEWVKLEDAYKRNTNSITKIVLQKLKKYLEKEKKYKNINKNEYNMILHESICY